MSDPWPRPRARAGALPSIVVALAVWPMSSSPVIGQNHIANETFWNEVYDQGQRQRRAPARTRSPARPPLAAAARTPAVDPSVSPSAGDALPAAGLDVPAMAAVAPLTTGSISLPGLTPDRGPRRSAPVPGNSFLYDVGQVGRYDSSRPTVEGRWLPVGSLAGAHMTLPVDARVLVTDTATGRAILVAIKDRSRSDRVVIELTQGALDVLAAADPERLRVRLTVIWTPTGEATFYPPPAPLPPRQLTRGD